MNRKSLEISCFEVLGVLFSGLKRLLLFLVIKTLYPDPDRYWPKMLDLGPVSMNPDPKHWLKLPCSCIEEIQVKNVDPTESDTGVLNVTGCGSWS
jgi:hypothetical protein